MSSMSGLSNKERSYKLIKLNQNQNCSLDKLVKHFDAWILNYNNQLKRPTDINLL